MCSLHTCVSFLLPTHLAERGAAPGVGRAQCQQRYEVGATPLVLKGEGSSPRLGGHSRNVLKALWLLQGLDLNSDLSSPRVHCQPPHTLVTGGRES